MQVLDHMLGDAGLDIQAAIDQPRWCYDVLTGNLRLEGRFAPAAAQQLADLGYQLRVEGFYSGMGQSQGVQILSDGVLAGGADPRSEGYVLWW